MKVRLRKSRLDKIGLDWTFGLREVQQRRAKCEDENIQAGEESKIRACTKVYSVRLSPTVWSLFNNLTLFLTLILKFVWTKLCPIVRLGWAERNSVLN